jgi:hypothetical protein
MDGGNGIPFSPSPPFPPALNDMLRRKNLPTIVTQVPRKPTDH